MKLFLGVGLVTLCGVVFWLWHERVLSPVAQVPGAQEREVVMTPPVPAMPETAPLPDPLPNEEVLPSTVLIPDVPFTVQAPFAQWYDPLFQDACEEASIIMAAAWADGRTLTKGSVTAAVQSLSRLEQKHFGQAVDTSLTDTTWLLTQYFDMTGAVRSGVTIDDMKQALAVGQIVIVPTDGRKLKNPNFKQPGPTHHMVVLIGYDTLTQEFIVNDPGTRNGQGYRYPQAVLYEAILDYATGDHVPVTSTAKVMLVVSKK